MDPYTITVQGFGSPTEAARIFEAITAVIHDADAPCRVSLNVKRDSDKAMMHRYEQRMAMLNR